MPINLAFAKLFHEGPDTRIGQSEISLVVLAISVEGNFLIVTYPGREEGTRIGGGGILREGGGWVQRKMGLREGHCCTGHQVDGIEAVVSVVLGGSRRDSEDSPFHQDIVMGDRHEGAGREGLRGIVGSGHQATVDAAIIGEAEEVSGIACRIKAVVRGHGDPASGGRPEHDAITLIAEPTAIPHSEWASNCSRERLES